MLFPYQIFFLPSLTVGPISSASLDGRISLWVVVYSVSELGAIFTAGPLSSRLLNLGPVSHTTHRGAPIKRNILSSNCLLTLFAMAVRKGNRSGKLEKKSTTARTYGNIVTTSLKSLIDAYKTSPKARLTWSSLSYDQLAVNF